MPDNISTNLKWLNEITSQFPKTEAPIRSIYEIAGFPRWETVVSNLLAFYFDATEQHGFKSLFFTSLLDLIEVKQPGFDKKCIETEFSVEREVSTKNGLFIDLLLSSIIENEEDDSKINKEDPDSWSIIIENKIDASLYNDLNEYYESTTGKNKIGVVLSLRDESTTISAKTQGRFVSITHKELIERVKLNLPEFYFDSNDRHLLMLKEYMSNIDSLYGNPQYSTDMDKTLKLFQEHGEKIKDLKKKDKELQTYLNKSVDTAMKSFGLYTKVRKQAAVSKHYYFREEEKHNEYKHTFRFWVNTSQLKYKNTLLGYFELFGKSKTAHGAKVLKSLESQKVFTNEVAKGEGGKEGGDFFHIYKIKIPLGEFEDGKFAEKLIDALRKSFFEHSNGFLQKAVDAYNQSANRQ